MGLSPLEIFSMGFVSYPFFFCDGDRLHSLKFLLGVIVIHGIIMTHCVELDCFRIYSSTYPDPGKYMWIIYYIQPK